MNAFTLDHLSLHIHLFNYGASTKVSPNVIIYVFLFSLLNMNSLTTNCFKV